MRPYFLRNNNIQKIESVWDKKSYKVAVNYIIYDKKRHKIVNIGTSKVCGINNNKVSIHAEENAIKYCLAKSQNNNCKRFLIYIWRFNSKKEIKPIHCCKKCSKLVKKYKLENKIFTIDNFTIKTAIIKNPSLSLGDKLRKNKKNNKNNKKSRKTINFAII